MATHDPDEFDEFDEFDDDERERRWQEWAKHLAPIDISMLIESGVPPYLFQDGVLDLKGLRALGWIVEQGIAAP